MRVWLIQPAEPMPVESGNNRLWRTGFTAQLLPERGHEVVWWASNFSHAQKSFRATTGDSVLVKPNYRIRFLPALGYRRNLSLARIRDHRHVARGFRRVAPSEPAPDIILASFPTIEMCAEAADYAKARGIPIVMDVRDQWPDLFYDTAPPILRPMVKLLCRGIDAQASVALRKATAITGNARQAVVWGLARAGRAATGLDRAFPMGYAEPETSPEQDRKARAFWADRGLGKNHGRFIVAYGGAVGKTGDFDTILKAATAMQNVAPDVLFVVAGVGDDLQRLRASAKGMPNILFTGWLGAPEMAELLRSASLGLVPYRDRANFEGGITNKPIEYLAFGLPVLTTLRKGELREVLEKNDCGIYYRAGEAEELVETVLQARDNPDRLAAASSRAMRLFESEFRAEKVYGDVIDHLEAVLREHAPGPRPEPNER